MMKNSRKFLNFVTFYPGVEFTPICFAKDVGMIPAIMEKDFGYHSTLVCTKTEGNGNYEQNIFNLRLDFIENKSNNDILYIFRHAREIDVLNLYFLSIRNCVLINLYKILNPRGIAYLKLDLGQKTIEGHANLTKWKRIILHILQMRIDITSAESETICKLFSTLFYKEIVRIPNGFYCYKESEDKYTKDNVILTVGRLGTEEKATEVLLDAFALTAQYHSWKLRLVGPIEEDFIDAIDSFYEKHPELCERVIFTREIFDKSELSKEYERAKIFVLPSRWESFGLVIVEAMAKGCYTILSDMVSPAPEMTNGGRYGRIVKADDRKDLADSMIKSIHYLEKEDLQEEIIKYSKQFEWHVICGKLDTMIKRSRKS